ncbi:ribonuclease H-like domain-containing protein [Tanacetum coccineum]
MRARKFYQRTGRKIIIDGSNTAGYDKSKVECFNCYRMGYFSRECKAPRSKDNRNWNQGSSSKVVKIEDASEKEMCAIDGVGFDWSDMEEEQIQANMTLMAFLDSEVTNDKSCSKSCLKNYEALKKQYDDLLVKLDDTGFKAATYKRGLATLEDQIVKYREHEVRFSEEIALLKRSVGHKEYQMGLLRDELEKVKQEKEGFDFKIAKFDKSAKDLNEMLESQITDKSKKGVGYHAVPSPHPLILNRPTPLDLSYSGLEEFKEPEVIEYGPRDSSLKSTTGCDKKSENSKKNTDDSLEQHQMTDTQTSSFESPLKVDKDWKEKFFYPANHVREVEPKKVRENNDAPIIEDWVSDDEDEVETTVVVKKKTVIPTAAKIEKPVRKPVRYAEMYRSQRPRGNQRNWNGQKSNQLGCNFVFNNKACFICGSFDHIQYSCPNQQRKRIVSGNNYNKKDNDYYSKTSHSSAHKHMAPRAVLMKTGLKYVNTARLVNNVRSVNTGRPFSTARYFNTVRPSYTAHPKSTIHCARPRTYFQNQAQSTVHRPFSKRTAFIKRCFNQKLDTGRPFRSTVNIVKASACWVWMPKNRVVDHVSKNISALVTLKRLDYIDAQGRFKSMDAQIQGRQECSKEKEESREECNKSRKTKKMKWEDCWELNTSELVLLSQQLVLLEENSSYCSRLQLPVLNQSVNTARITAVGEKVNAAESLLVVSTEAITEASLRRHLKLDDHDGITSIPNSEIFEQLALMGYHTDSDKLTFQKGAFSPQWRFLIHTILHCLSPKKTAWEQFSSNIATAVICLATNRRFNFSRLIFEHMVSNISSPHKFLMYPRFIQICLDMQRKQLQQHSRTYHVPSLSIKVFNNMKRPTKGYSGQEVDLFPTMLHVHEPSTSPLRITSSPSHSHEPSPSHSHEPSIEHSPDHTIVAVSFPSPTQPTQPLPGAEQHIPTLMTHLSIVLEDDLKKTKQTYSAAITKLILRVKILEAKVKAGTARKGARVVLSEDDEDVEDDSSKQGRKLFDAEKGNSEVSTAGATKGTASEVPVISTAEENISTAGRTVTYRRRSEEERTRKDKGKAIMTEPEPKKKSKKEIKQERLSFAKAIRLQEQMNEEQRAHIARDEEIARQWDEEEKQRAMSEAKSTKEIDWNDPSVIRYHALKMKPKTVAQARRNMVKYLKNQGNYKISDFKRMSYNEIRPIFEKVWDFNQHIEPIEHGSEKMKSLEKIEEEDVDTQKEMKEVSKESGAKRKKSLPRKSTRSTVKRQKMEEDAEKEDLKGYLDIVPREEVAEDVESLSTKYPIVDWKTYVLTENFMYNQVFRGDGSSKNYKI